MDENICPNCDEEFDKKTTFEEGMDFSVSAEHTTLDQVCVFNAHDEVWVYLHLPDESVEGEFEVPDDGEPVDLSGFIQELRAEGDS